MVLKPFAVIRSQAIRSYSFAPLLALLYLFGPNARSAANPLDHEVSRVAAASEAWRFTRIEGRKDGETFNSVMKVADTTKSDLDFAGLVLRCAPKGKIEVMIALIRPLPPRSHPQVTLTDSGTSQTFEGTMLAAGAAVLLPDEAAALAGGRWQSVPSLAVSVKEDQDEIKGVVALKGLREAFYRLFMSCAQ